MRVGAVEAVKLGLVGCGGYARTLAKSCVKSEKIELVACYDVLPEAAQAFESEFGCKAMESEDALLGRSDIEGVVIVTSNEAHMPNAVAAAKAGKHVFVDKPIAHTISDALAMIEACRQAGVVLAVGHNQRRNPGHRKLKEILDAGEIGTVVTAEANFSHSGGMHLKGTEWRCFRDKCPALPLMQLGVHHCDTLQYLLGDVVEVSSFVARIAIGPDNDDTTVNLLRFDRGPLGYLGSNYATPAIYYINIYGTGGNLFCEGGGVVRFRKPDSKEPKIIEVSPVDTHAEQLEEFAGCIRTGARPEVSGEDGLKALAIVEAALKSSCERRPVRIAEVIIP